jgi:hypothetical protein
MKKYNNVRPTGLKGGESIARMQALMGVSAINEDTNHSVVELSKLGPDGRVYGIVRENHKYFIKIANNKPNLVTEDFSYIGGLQNKTSVVYESYAKAVKHLNLKFISINEAKGERQHVDILKNDNLLSESFESYNEAPKPSQPDTLMGTVKSVGKNDGHDKEVIGDSGETGNPDVSTPPVVEEDEDCEDCEMVDENELTETEKAIDKMILEVRLAFADEAKGKSVPSIKGNLSIATAIKKINEGTNSGIKKKA